MASDRISEALADPLRLFWEALGGYEILHREWLAVRARTIAVIRDAFPPEVWGNIHAHSVEQRNCYVEKLIRFSLNQEGLDAVARGIVQRFSRDSGPKFMAAATHLILRFPRLHEGFSGLDHQSLKAALRWVVYSGIWEDGVSWLRQQEAAPGVAGVWASSTIGWVPQAMPRKFDRIGDEHEMASSQDFPAHLVKDLGGITIVPPRAGAPLVGQIAVSFEAGADHATIRQAFENRLAVVLAVLPASPAAPRRGRPPEWAQQIERCNAYTRWCSTERDAGRSPSPNAFATAIMAKRSCLDLDAPLTINDPGNIVIWSEEVSRIRKDIADLEWLAPAVAPPLTFPAMGGSKSI